MSRKQKVKIYSCIHCGSQFEAYPPDDRHNIATRNESDYEDHIKVNYRCKDCGKDNIMFWGYPKPIALLG